MFAAIVGLVGAALGATAALLSSALSDRRQARSEQFRWRRDQVVAAWEGAMRYLLRAANRRSQIDGAVLKVEHQREWFDDLIEAQFWLHRLAGLGAELDNPTNVRIEDTVHRFDELVRDVVGGVHTSGPMPTPVWGSLQATIHAVQVWTGGYVGSTDETPPSTAPVASHLLEELRLYMAQERSGRETNE